MKVSAVLSAHNHEKYVVEAVNALIPQVDQVVLIDDGSSDATSEIIKGQDWPTVVKIFHNKPYGVSESYNEAIAAASGEIILIQGADDISTSNRAQIQTNLIMKHPDSVAFSKPIVINSQGNVLPVSVADEFNVEINDSQQMLTKMYFTGNFICAPSIAFKKSLFESSRGFLNGIDSLQDYSLWLELLNQGVTFLRTSPVIYYRKHGENLSAERMSNKNKTSARYSAELDFVLDDFINRASSQTLSSLGKYKGINIDPRSEIEFFALKCLLRISHNNPSVLRRGVVEIFSGLNIFEPNVFLEVLGIERSELTTLSLQAGFFPTH